MASTEPAALEHALVEWDTPLFRQAQTQLEEALPYAGISEFAAERLELPAGTIASRISRCLAKLREAFEGRREPAAASGTTER